MTESAVLLIEEDPALCEAIRAYLAGFNYTVHAYAEAAVALARLPEFGLPRFALISMTPAGALSSLEAARQLKDIADLPLLFFYPADSASIDIEELRRYADDFLVKPFALPELDARLRIVLARRPKLELAGESLMQVDDNMSVDFAHSLVTIAGRAVRLTPTEVLLLHTLLHQAPRVVNNQTLLARAWNAEKVREDTLRVHMHRLRRKLESDSQQRNYIYTERGVGYRFAKRPLSLQEADAAKESATAAD